MNVDPQVWFCPPCMDDQPGFLHPDGWWRCGKCDHRINITALGWD